MCKKYILLTVSTVLILSVSIFAQGEFLRPGEGGWGFAPAYTFGELTEARGFDIGVSIQGKVALAFTYARNDDFETNSYSPTITYHVKSDQPNRMYGVAITAGYARMQRKFEVEYRYCDYSYCDRYLRTIKDTIDCAVLGLGVYVNLYPTKGFMMQYFLSGSLLTSLGGEYEHTATGLTAGLTLGFAQSSWFRPFATGGVTLSNNEDARVFTHAGGGLVAAWK